jgi:hypothetical protein
MRNRTCSRPLTRRIGVDWSLQIGQRSGLKNERVDDHFTGERTVYLPLSEWRVETLERDRLRALFLFLSLSLSLSLPLSVSLSLSLPPSLSLSPPLSLSLSLSLSISVCLSVSRGRQCVGEGGREGFIALAGCSNGFCRN